MNQVSKGVQPSWGAFINLREVVQYFVGRLDIFTQLSLAPGMIDMMVKVIVELISALVLVTKSSSSDSQSSTVQCVLTDVTSTQRNAGKF